MALGVVEANFKDKRTADWVWWCIPYKRLRQRAEPSLDSLLLEGTEEEGRGGSKAGGTDGGERWEELS